MGNPATVLPGAMDAILALGKATRKAGVPPATLEPVHPRAGRINGCAPCVDGGARGAEKAGESDGEGAARGTAPSPPGARCRWRPLPSDPAGVARAGRPLVARPARREDPMADAEDVRKIALSLPETSEKLSWGAPTFRVRGKIFAALADDDASIGVKCPVEDRAELIAAEPEKFFLRPGHDDNFAWLRVRLAALEDEEELRAILLDSWRQAAPKALAAAHEDQG
jgi:AhpD family alkylhydroperoxidase